MKERESERDRERDRESVEGNTKWRNENITRKGYLIYYLKIIYLK